MAIQYYMRGYNIGAPGAVGYVDWVVNDTPDSAATYVPAPYTPANITNITVNRTVTSKVDNFLKPFESLTAIGGTGNDGYFFHLNSYDWLHATPPGPPIAVPSYLTGLSVVRGSLTGAIPRDYSTLFWAENALKWLFAYNTNGDGYTIGAALPVGMGSLSIDGYLEVGTTPAQSGIIRIPNNQFIVSRTADGYNDGYLVGLDNVNRIRLGRASDGYQIYIPTNLRVDGYIRDGYSNTATAGFIRNGHGTNIITFRNTSSNDSVILRTDNVNNTIYLGDTFNDGISYTVGALKEHIFNINTNPLIYLGDIGGTSYIKFDGSATLPTITQNIRPSGSGHPLTLKAQDTLGNNGGSIVVSSGGGPSADGYIDLSINRNPKIRIFGSTAPAVSDFTNNSINNPNSIQVLNPAVRFYNTMVSPSIIQDPITGVDGQPFLILAQTVSGLIPSRIGGDLILSSGASTANANDGYVKLQTGQINRLFVNAKDGYITQTLRIFAFNGLDGAFDAAAVINPIIKQRDDITNSITGQLMTIQSQNTTGINTIGGSLNITSGLGTRSNFEGDGYVRLQTGGTTRLLLDGYNTQATLTLKTFSFNSTITAPVIRQIDNTTNNNIAGQLMTIQAQNTTGANTIGAGLNLTSGHGTRINLEGDGYVRLQTGGTTRVLLDGYNSQETLTLKTFSFNGLDGYSDQVNIINPVIRQRNDITNSITANSLTIQSQNATGTNTIGGNLLFQSGIGTTVVPSGPSVATPYLRNGRIFFESGAITNNIGEFGVDGYGSYFSSGGTIAAPAAIDGYFRAPNNVWALSAARNPATNPNASIHLIGTDGYNKILLGDVNTGLIFNTSLNSVYDFQVSSISNKIMIGDGYIRSGAAPANSGIFRNSQTTQVATDIVSIRNVTASNDLKLLGVDGYDRITHGSAALNKGHIFDTAVDGYYDFRVNGIPSAFIDGYKLAFKVGRRRHITPVATTYPVLVTDDFLAVTASSVYTITLPLVPNPVSATGDTYEFKDINGTSSSFNVTISGNGNNIDGSSALVMNTNFASFVVTWTGAQWSVS